MLPAVSVRRFCCVAFGSGNAINPVLPEQAVRELRDVSPRKGADRCAGARHEGVAIHLMVRQCRLHADANGGET